MEIILKVDGMTCSGCKAAVERVLAAQPGVEHVTVDLNDARAVVTASDVAKPNDLAAAVEGAGYDARVES